MRPKTPFRNGDGFSYLYNQVLICAKGWPVKKDVERVGLSIDESGTLYVWNRNAAAWLIRAALYPQDLSLHKGFAAYFNAVYGRSPDFVLHLVSTIRKSEKKSSPIRLFFRDCAFVIRNRKQIEVANATDKEIAAQIKKISGISVSPDAVKFERLLISHLAQPFEKAKKEHEKIIGSPMR